MSHPHLIMEIEIAKEPGISYIVGLTKLFGVVAQVLMTRTGVK